MRSAQPEESFVEPDAAAGNGLESTRLNDTMQGSESINPKDASSESSSFTYTPLDTKVDSIRLVRLHRLVEFEDSRVMRDTTIQSTTPHSAVPIIRCEIVDATFREKPKFDALSYTWGDHSEQFIILLNGKPFCVGKNLHDALTHLRLGSQAHAELYWIDAICINQSNIEEKNQQIPFMPYIYGRAQRVVVWLGRGEGSSDILQGFRPTEPDTQFDGEDMSEADLLECSRGTYWKRVWIIQEITKARSIVLMKGNFTRSFDAFIADLRWHFGGSGNDCKPLIPLTLDEQRKDRFGKSHLLQTLLVNHRDAECKNPRDHVYGFLGLATNVAGKIKVDYGKPLFEVYSDVFMFLYQDPEASSEGWKLLSTMRLVENLLGGSDIVKPLLPRAGEIHGSYTYQCTEPTIDEHILNGHGKDGSVVFRIPARVAGQIVALGPTYNDMMGVVSSEDKWTVMIRESLKDRHMIKQALSQNEAFVRAIEDFQENDNPIVYSMPETAKWARSTPCEAIPIDIAEQHHRAQYIPALKKTESDQRGAVALETSMCFMRGAKRDHENIGRLGLAPAGTMVGDWLCEIDGVTGVVVLGVEQFHKPSQRYPKGTWKYIIRGCAGLTSPWDEYDTKKAINMFQAPDFQNVLDNTERIELCIGIGTAWLLSHSI